MSEPITESIVTPEWIAAVRTNYGLDTRTPFEAGAVWAAHGVVAGAVTALGHALNRIEELQRLATPELAAVVEAARGLAKHREAALSHPAMDEVLPHFADGYWRAEVTLCRAVAKLDAARAAEDAP